MINVKASSILPVVATLDPVAVTTAEVFTDVVDMSKYDQVIAFLMCGDIVVGSTVDFRFVGCDSNGANPTASVKAATQRAADATANDNTQIILTIRGAEMPATKPRYGKFGVVGASTGGPMAIIVLAVAPKYGVASDLQLATVVETK